MRGGNQADVVRVQQPGAPSLSPGNPQANAQQSKLRMQSLQLLRTHGMAGVISAFYVFMLVFLQLGLMKWSDKKFTLTC